MVESLSSFFMVTLSVPSLANSATVPTGGAPSSVLVTTHLPTRILARSSSARAFPATRHTATATASHRSVFIDSLPGARNTVGKPPPRGLQVCAIAERTRIEFALGTLWSEQKTVRMPIPTSNPKPLVQRRHLQLLPRLQHRDGQPGVLGEALSDRHQPLPAAQRDRDQC